jgi:Protein of unknown function (DUF2478)
MIAPLAAVRFVTEDVDGFLAGLAANLTAQGWRLAGVIQSRGEAGTECHCADMDLTSLATGDVFRISQPLGNGAHGCRLDPGALAHCSAALERDIATGPDLLVLNRFGHGESEGRGFRDLIAQALDLGVPVLTAVRPTYARAWADFGGEIACDLPMQADAVLAWALAQEEARHAA